MGWLIGLAGLSLLIAGEDGLVDNPNPAIERMSISVGDWVRHEPGGPLAIVGAGGVMELEDGSSFPNQAGTYPIRTTSLERVEIEGSTLRFVLQPPPGGLLLEQTGEDHGGHHHMRGTLAAASPLVLVSTAGSSSATLTGIAEIVSNEPEWYGDAKFHYFASVPGSRVPFEMTYWLRGGATWQADSFDRDFQYGASGWVDFAHPVFVPEVASLEIRGSAQVPQHAVVPYFVVVHYANGVARVSEAIAWDAQPSASADIDAGVLTAGAFEHDRQPLTVHAVFTSSGVQHRASKDILGRLTRGVGAQNAWPTYQADARHTGYVPNIYDPETFSLRWEAVVRPGFPLNPVTGADGRVFATIVQYFDTGSSLFALDAKEGELIWSRDFGEVFSVNPPAWAHGNVYVQTGWGNGSWLHAFDAATGARFFRAPFEAQFERYYAPTLQDGSAYVNAGAYGGMYSFDAFSGRQEWSAGLSQYDEWTPAVAGDTAYAFLGASVFYSAGLYVLDRHSGQRRRFIPDPNFLWDGWSMRSAPVVLDDKDVIGVHDGRVLRFDVGGETVAWERLDQYIGQPTVARGTIYAINGDHVEALDLSSGTELWRWTPPPGEGGPAGTMIVTDSHLFVSTTVAVHAVDLRTQESSWSYPAAGWIALADDNLYIARADGTLTALLAAPDRRAKPPSSRPFSGRSRR